MVKKPIEILVSLTSISMVKNHRDNSVFNFDLYGEKTHRDSSIVNFDLYGEKIHRDTLA